MNTELKPLVFQSATSILKWADKKQIEYLSDDQVFYVEKDNLYYYFSKHEDNKYYLVMQSERNLGEKNNG